MAGPHSTTVTIDGELLITIWPRDCVRWEGTRAQLIAEGLIPVDLGWPTGRSDVEFRIGRFDYWLSRCRPPGMKGPLREWVNGDHWRLDRRLTATRGQGCYAERIYQAQQDLAREVFNQPPEGFEQARRALEAACDKAFQRFRMAVPGLGRGKTGRRQ